MLSRTAENLYWLARYVERAEYLARTIEATLRVTALPNTYIGKTNEWDSALLTAGVDVWVNTPRRPYEASGTSGMKAALNGVPSLSILDGWWIEGCLEGYTGWAIEDGADDADEATHLYEKLEKSVVPLYLKSPEAWGNLMRTTIAYNGSFFNTNRMVKQYIRNAYYPVTLVETAAVEEQLAVSR